jgi:flagellar basal-body rod modification protein FlgD
MSPEAINGTGSTNTALPSETTGSQELGKEAFLKLLISQMQHQDPLEPMKNSEFVAQLATFSNVEQLVSVNEGINMLGIQQMGMTNAQAAGFIGKKVEVKSNILQVTTPGETVHAGFNLEGDAESVEVHIRNSAGAVVRTIEMGPQPKGEVAVEWNTLNDQGTQVPPGQYKIDVVAADETGAPVTFETRIKGYVDGVTYDSGYPELVIGSVKALMSDIIGVYPSTDVN